MEGYQFFVIAISGLSFVVSIIAIIIAHNSRTDIDNSEVKMAEEVAKFVDMIRDELNYMWKHIKEREDD